MYTATTRNIKITVMPMFLTDQSDAEEMNYFWAYTIQMENYGQETVKLLNRYWKITDATGNVQEVRGPGVVGEHPVLGPGERYQYTSGCALTTTSGMMAGYYEMQAENGERFPVEIPAFSLDSPEQRKRPN